MQIPDKNNTHPKDPPAKTITVSGVTFSASQVKSATVTINNRDIHISETKEKKKKIGFF